MSRGSSLVANPSEDVARRAEYEALARGDHQTGPAGSIVFCVYTVDLDEGRGDVYVAAGLGLALVDMGFGVRLVPRADWYAIDDADVVVSMLPVADPTVAPPGALRVAWVRNEVDRWADAPYLDDFDVVVASSELAAARLRRSCDRVAGVVPIGVDGQLFCGPGQERARSTTAVATVNFWGTVRDAHTALMELPADADVVMHGQARDAPMTLQRWHRPALSYFALPELYRGAGIVIDDLNSTTLGYGALNSRLFESAACGALPLVNGTLGLAAAGLPGLPRYRNPTELAARLSELRAEPAMTAEWAGRVQRCVLAEHTWDKRAESFLRLLSQARGAEDTSARSLHYYPDWAFGNPFQTMLNARLGDAGTAAVPVPDVMDFLKRNSRQSREREVLHIHWTAPILQWTAGPFHAYQVFQQFKWFLDAFVRKGGRLIWTVHNVLPHDANHRLVERELASLLAERASVVHVLSEATMQAAEAEYDLDPAKVRLIAHSSYVDQYPDWISREAARQQLGLHPSEKVLLALGGIRPYKGLDLLLDVFDRLLEQDPTLRLLVAGKPGAYPEVRRLQERCEDHPRVVPVFSHLPDDRLQVWMRSADLGVMPYRAILNSGIFHLAQTFGLPVVGPDAGAMSSWRGHPSVRVFDPSDEGSLLRTLSEAIRVLVDDPAAAEAARRAALESATSNSPDQMAAAFAELVEQVWLSARPTL